MKISLILCTIHRVDELGRFLSSLSCQKNQNFELIIVDQNPDDRLQSLCKNYANSMALRHFQVNFKGLSRARNFGLQYASGDIIAFPDDDCWYGDIYLLKTVSEIFKKDQQIDMVSFPAFDGRGEGIANFPKHPAQISLYNILQTVISFSLFSRSTVLAQDLRFNEALGVGSPSPTQSGEETDWVLRALAKGYTAQYLTSASVNHPRVRCQYHDPAYQRKIFLYSLGYGQLLKQYRFPVSVILRSFIRPLGGALIFLLQGQLSKAKYHAKIFKGRFVGYFLKPW